MNTRKKAFKTRAVVQSPNHGQSIPSTPPIKDYIEPFGWFFSQGKVLQEAPESRRYVKLWARTGETLRHLSQSKKEHHADLS